MKISAHLLLMWQLTQRITIKDCVENCDKYFVDDEEAEQYAKRKGII